MTANETRPRGLRSSGRDMGALVACGLVLAACCLELACASTGIRLRLVNNTGRDLRDVKISYKGGDLAIDVKAGASYRATIRPTESTSVDVTFSLASGEKKSEKIRAQLEPGYHGDLRLEITPDGRVGWEKHLTRHGARAPEGSLSPLPGT